MKFQGLEGARRSVELYIKREAANPSKYEKKTVTAEKVIIAAGCLGTTEILLRCKERGTLPGLSDKVGVGFSTNGDYLAFLEKTKEGQASFAVQ